MTKSTQIYSSLKVPALSGSILTIDVKQTLDGKLTLDAPKKPQVVIQGPRFSLTPAEIAGVYPAPGSEESADEFLPHIAISRRTLPWERLGVGAVAPWLALILVRESELREGENLNESATGTVKAQTLADINTNDSAGRNAINAAGGVDNSTSLNILYLKNKLWKSIAPAKEDLPLLSHVRRSTVHPDSGPDVHTDVAIVVGNRLPLAWPAENPELHTAFLISVAGRNDLFTSNSRTDNQKVALVVLHHWSFRPSTGGDFESVIRAIRYRPNGGVLRFGNLPKAPDPGHSSPLSGGYDAALNTYGAFIDPLPHTQSGQVTWRGPLRPFSTPDRSQGFAIRPAPEEFVDADANTPKDYSHAAAFELGRLLALANAGILEDLRDVRGHIKVPNPPVAVNKLPPALQKPDWVVDPAWDQWFEEPWSFGAVELVKDQTAFLGVGKADVSNIDVAQWGDVVLVDLGALPAANQGPLVSIDVNTVDATKLGKEFPQVEIGGH